MPTLRWFGRRSVTSLPSMRIVPAVGVSKPATMRSVVVLPQPDRAEEGDELAALRSARSKSCTTVLRAVGLLQVLDLEEAIACSASAVGASCRAAPRPRDWIRPMQAQVTTKAMIASADGS